MLGQGWVMPGQLPGYARVWLRLWLQVSTDPHNDVRGMADRCVMAPVPTSQDNVEIEEEVSCS